MEDLLRPQILDSCKLSLPEGLKDLMSDISREVLRAQPRDLYNFIADYLEALLIARETLSIACHVCRDVFECSCQPELEDELRNVGLEGEALETAMKVVMEYFDKSEVKEGNLLMKLLKKTNIDEEMLHEVQKAVRAAFQKHRLNHQTKLKAETHEFNESGQKAAERTLKIYEHTKDEQKQAKDKAATVIQMTQLL